MFDVMDVWHAVMYVMENYMNGNGEIWGKIVVLFSY
jgi:hypothetical protein